MSAKNPFLANMIAIYLLWLYLHVATSEVCDLGDSSFEISCYGSAIQFAKLQGGDGIRNEQNSRSISQNGAF